MAKSYVKALYDYNSGEAGDLRFKTGAIIQVLNQIDENWIKGEHDGNIGLFPANFVEPFVDSAANEKWASISTFENKVSNISGKTVVANETYISGDDGVLTFFRGDELIFLRRVDEYWCQGSYASEVGLFPAHLVDGLDNISPSPQFNDSAKTIPSITEPRCQITDAAKPTSLQSNITQPNPHEPHVKALFEFKGLSEFELSFPAGKIVFLTKDIDAEWFEGIYNGSTGIFPKSFVEVLIPLPKDHQLGKDLQSLSEHQPLTNAQSLAKNQVGNIQSRTLDVPYAITIYPFVGETSSELSFREGETIFLHHWVSPEWIQGECNGRIGIFPSTFVQIEKELPQDFEEESGTTVGTGDGLSLTKGLPPTLEGEIVNSVFKSGDKALAIYSYATDIKGDLGLEVGDLIWIVQIIDEEWVLGRKGDSVGLCPAVFLELQTDELKRSQYNGTGQRSEINLVNAESVIPMTNTGSTPVSVSLAKTKPNHVPSSQNKPSTIGSMYMEATSPKAETSSTSGLARSTELETNHAPSIPSRNVPKATTRPEIQLSPPSPLAGNPPNRLETKPLSRTITNTPKLEPATLSLGAKPPLAPKPLISPKPDFLKKPVKPVSSAVKPVLLPKPVIPASPGFSKANENNWVTFEDPSETSIFPTSTFTQSKPTPPSRNKTSPRMSYKTLLDKSLEEDVTIAFPLEPNKVRPVAPPRVDLMGSRSSTDDALSLKLMEQADQFEKSSSRQNSPSLNELRELSKSQKPVPAKRSKQSAKPLTEQDHGGSNQGFPILDDLDEQITKLNNELQKENKVLSGVEVLIQTVNKETSRRGELESKKGITERKIEDLKRQLKKIEDQKKRLVKLLAGYSSQEEIHLKIQQLQESIKENTDTKENLESLLSDCDEEEVRSELTDNITFCDEAIKNLKSELNSLQDLVAQLEGKVVQEVSGKDVTLRKKVIDEILNTEKSFARDLNLCLKHFMMQLIEWKVDIIDCDLLFGNMEEVAALSGRLLERLETATQDIDINDQIIGTCFVDFSEEMTIVYGKYCRNHDEAIAFLEKSADNEEIQQYFKKCLESIRAFSNCWDLSSFLIKPVQRILKYPLLLNELLKNTPDEHPDKPGLIKAIEVVTIAANDVNEFKRRKELVQKYQKVEESGLSTKFQKFTWHSVVKKSSRFNQRITQFTGLVSQTVDAKFIENERLFYQIEKTAKNFIKNITQYIEQFEDVHENLVQTCENITDFCKDNATTKNIEEYNEAQRFIGEDLVNKLKHVLDEEVLSPLNTLINLFQGPHRLIQKRHDKCLDYDSWSNKVEKIKDREKRRQAKDELEFAKKNYEALNAQLLDELPILNTKSLKFLHTCISNFACVHKNFFVEALDQFSPSVQLSVVNSGSVDIISDFFSQNKVASHDVFQLAFTPKKSLTLTRPLRPNASPKASRSNLLVDDKYFKTRSLTRSASESKRKAPLPPAFDGGGSPIRSRTVSAADRSLLVRKRVELDFEASPSGDPTYILKYTFNAEAPTELCVNKDDVVRVLQYHDAFGHSEWWKVEHNGKIGFVPSSFLAPYRSTIGMVSLTGNTSMVGKGGEKNMVSKPGQTGSLARFDQTSMVPNGSHSSTVAITGETNMVPNTSLTHTVLKSGQTGNGNVMNMTDHLVKYDFDPHGPSELGVVTGELVRVVQECDLSGSNAWWLVEARGKQGYVPASYLVKRE